MKINDLFESRSDDWLEKYTLEGLDKFPSNEVVLDLLNRYPNDKTMTLYRGMNFRTKDKYDQFMDHGGEGKVTFNGISSWSPDKGTAEQFALTRPSYFLDYETMKAHGEASKKGEELTGYRGVILSTTIKQGKGIDVNKSDFSKENEVILPPGTYQVIVDIIKPFEELSDELDIDSIVQRFLRQKEKSHDYMEKFAQYIIDRIPNRLKEDTIKDIIDTYGSFEISQSNIHFNELHSNEYYDGEVTIVHNTLPFYFYNKGVLPEDYEEHLRAMAKKLLSQLTAISKRYPTYKINSDELKDMADVMGMSQIYDNALKRTVGKGYKELTKRSVIDDINKISDPNEKKKAIEKYKNKLKDLLGGL